MSADLTSGATLGIREADCGCCVIVDTVALNALRAAWRAVEQERRAETCTCGMSEQERTGHSPEHEDWCEVTP